VLNVFFRLQLHQAVALPHLNAHFILLALVRVTMTTFAIFALIDKLVDVYWIIIFVASVLLCFGDLLLRCSDHIFDKLNLVILIPVKTVIIVVTKVIVFEIVITIHLIMTGIPVLTLKRLKILHRYHLWSLEVHLLIDRIILIHVGVIRIHLLMTILHRHSSKVFEKIVLARLRI
jgi:hypothetical protein